ncbi:MAG TPA: hypothetical protein VN969_06145 [Streptosporangiaceae bacterium]|nr:hypothetical protein [Streptosporangiaceae bacterium]
MRVDDLVRRALDREIGRLQARESFHVVEFAVDGVIFWQISRDNNGTPRAEHWPPRAVGEDAGEFNRSLVVRRLTDGGQVIFVRSSPDVISGEVLALFREIIPNMEVIDCIAGFEDVLRASIKDSPLISDYELVLLRKTRSGRLDLEPVRMFTQGQQQPDRSRTIRVKCARSDERGVAFAIVTKERARDFQLMSIQSAELGPGEYELTAELLRPGRVRFHGLPASVKLRNDHRTWGELLGAVPARLQAPQPAHLVCLVEVSGTSEQIEKRTDRVREVIRAAGASEGLLTVSLLSYGAHSFERKIPEEPVRELVWAAPGAEAFAALDELEQHVPVANDYRYAAQLECALARVAGRVDPREGRLVILTVGSRRPFPPRADPQLDILPCPHRNNWRKYVEVLSGKDPRLALGSIHDKDTRDLDVWRELGRTAIFTSDVVDAWHMAATLGIGAAPVNVPFPLVWQDSLCPPRNAGPTSPTSTASLCGDRRAAVRPRFSPPSAWR